MTCPPPDPAAAYAADGRVPHGHQGRAHPPEAALPPSRTLAADLGVSRWTVTQAYAQLVTEGYLTARTGSATRVSWTPRPDLDEAPGLPARPPEPVPSGRPVRSVLRPPRPPGFSPPQMGRGDQDRRRDRAVRSAGLRPVGWASAAAGSACRAPQPEPGRGRGACHDLGVLRRRPSMSQVSHALLADGQVAIGVEDPGSTRLWQAARTAGLELVGLPVDDDGLVVGELEKHPGLRGMRRRGAAGGDRLRARTAPAVGVAGLGPAGGRPGHRGRLRLRGELRRAAPAVMQGTDRERWRCSGR